MTNRHRLKTLAALAFIACSAVGLSQARADSRAWTAAKGMLPTDTAYVIGANINPFKQSKLFKQFWGMAMAQQKDFGDATALLKKNCKIDITTALDSVVVALNDKMQGGVYLSLNKITEPKFTACLIKVAKKKDKKTIKAAKDGKIVTYTGGDKTINIGWLDANTLVFTTTPEDKASLSKVMTASTLSADLTKAIGSVKTDAALWGAAVKAVPIPQGKGTLKMGYGSLDLAGGNITLDGHIIMSSPAEAKAIADEANKNLAALPADLDMVKKGMKVTASQADVAIAFTTTEKEVLELVKKYMPQPAGGGATPKKGAK